MKKNIYKNSKTYAKKKKQNLICDLCDAGFPKGKKMRNQNRIHCHGRNPFAPLTDKNKNQKIKKKDRHSKTQKIKERDGNYKGHCEGKKTGKGSAESFFFSRLNRENRNNSCRNCKVELKSLSAKNCKHSSQRDFYCVGDDGFHEKSIACKSAFCNC